MGKYSQIFLLRNTLGILQSNNSFLCFPFKIYKVFSCSVGNFDAFSKVESFSVLLIFTLPLKIVTIQRKLGFLCISK